MQRITSAQNHTIKMIRQFGTSAKLRKEFNQTLFEGIHLCQAYLESGGEPVYCVISDSSLKNPEVVAIASQLREEECILVPDSLFTSLSTVENGVGILFVVSIPESEKVERIITDALLLDGVQDPGNMGTLLRTAAAAGVQKVYLSEGSASAWSPKVIRAGMGAHMALEIHEKADLVTEVKNATVPVFTTSLHAKKTLYEAGLTQPSAWLFGAEGAGVSEELLSLTEGEQVIIPQESNVESLNVAAAAAICLFEQRRQRLSDAIL